MRHADDGLAVSYLRVALAAIKTVHLLAGLSLDLRPPRLAMVLDGISRIKGACAAAGGPRGNATVLAASPPTDTPIGTRDQAMPRLGFDPALRCSELGGRRRRPVADRRPNAHRASLED